MHKILITGATGLIGRRLTEMLLREGHVVTHLSRGESGTPGVRTYRWDVQKAWIDPQALEGVDTVIHLAGAGIADKPWTEKRKREIIESRTCSTRLLYKELRKTGTAAKTFISASAIGYYGFDDNETWLHEDSPAGGDFLAGVVKRWEAEVDDMAALGLRVVKVRIGIVLSPEGGAMKELLRPVRWYLGAPLGSGEQVISWIHIDDLCRIFAKAVTDNAMSGAYNGVAPNPATNREFTSEIAHVLRRPIILPPIPGFVLKFLLGEMADLVLRGNKVSAEKIQATGFQFAHPTLAGAVRHLLAG